MSNLISNFEPVYQQPKKADEVAACQKCQSTWFEQFSVKQFKASHTAVLGQYVPPATAYEFVVIRCIKCGEKYQPNVLVGAQDQAAKLYNQFLDHLEDPKPAVETTPETKP